MFSRSIRPLVRSFSAVRPLSSVARFHRQSQSSLLSVCKSAPVKFTAPVTARAFSVSSHKSSASSDLLKALNDELAFEKEQESDPNNPAVPDFLKDFKSDNVFQIHDQPGSNEVKLTRDFNDEKIELFFSVDDITAAQEDVIEGEEPVQENLSFPVSVVINVTKPGKPQVGAVTFHTVADGGNFHIDNVTFTSDVKLTQQDNAETDYQRRGLYVGPVFSDLDDVVQEKFYEYLQARRIDSALAEFIPSYIEWKEQKEYVKWLDSVKKFVE
ncbi:mitochondrial glycoprotein [Paraphysoderma sedebokerense]|nr:mitochondrial glycoprotein [Paraphysoderma sedebokerense]